MKKTNRRAKEDVGSCGKEDDALSMFGASLQTQSRDCSKHLPLEPLHPATGRVSTAVSQIKASWS